MPSKSQLTYLKSLFEPALNATAGTGLFPETLITQRILESGWTVSKLDAYHNYFGIKADASWKGACVSVGTHEVLNGKKTFFAGTNKLYRNRAEALAGGAHFQTLFRAYPTLEAGFRGWVDFLKTNPRYTKAGLFLAKTPQEQFKALHAAGYATAPNYSTLLMSIFNPLAGFFKSFRDEIVKKKANQQTPTSVGLYGRVAASMRFFLTGK